MFLSFGSDGRRDLARDQDSVLIDGLEGIAWGQGQANYQARHRQLENDGWDDDVPDLDTSDELAEELVGQLADELAEDTVDEAASSLGTAIIKLDDEWIEPEDFRFAVRPYTWTQGRTRPVQDLDIETLVSTAGDAGRYIMAGQSAEHTAIVALCADVRSVAEVAALLAVPLGVARVLLADMIDGGVIHVHRNPTGSGSEPDLSLMERVLAGLHRI